MNRTTHHALRPPVAAGIAVGIGCVAWLLVNRTPQRLVPTMQSIVEAAGGIRCALAVFVEYFTGLDCGVREWVSH
ncbi:MULTISPECIES: hypothetical protein [unclassified Nocardia]|uniref:hypothetical protein n=1 Tax=unclassified Nocardia TaxID=2637762 RepID=UPI001CE4006B|nr:MULTISPECIES: hypothetical protein [unclassified Nocardia]